MSAIESLFVLSIASCGSGAAAGCFLPRRSGRRIFAGIGVVASAAVMGIAALASPVPFEADLWRLPTMGPLHISIDRLSGLFLLVTGIVFLTSSIFAASDLRAVAGRSAERAHAVMVPALLGSIVWLLGSGDVFSLLVAWEIMSILCYLLVSQGRERTDDSSAGYLMLALGEAGALAMAIGLLVLAVHAGSLDFAALRASAGSLDSSTRWWVFLLTFFGFGVKAGLVPVNAWLPRAYASAPDTFAPVLAGALLNLGLYGILRVSADLLPPRSMGPGLVALVIGSFSALIGILYATTENDLGTILAHSSIENAGIITAGFGAGLVFTAAGDPALAGIAFLAALYHLVNHSIYKSLLFVGAGVVRDRAGSRDLDRLGGLVRLMPRTSIAFLAGVMGIAALPPLNGFVSEWLTLQTLLRSAELAPASVKLVFVLCGAMLALTAALAVTCFVKVYAMGFLGMARSPGAEAAREGPTPALVSMAILAICCLMLGVLPTYVIGGLDRSVEPMGAGGAAALTPPFFRGSPGHGDLPAAFLSEFHDLGARIGEGVAPGPGLVILHRGGASNPVVFAASPTWLVIVLVILVAVVFALVRWVVSRHRAVTRAPAWDGGIRRLLPEMTYTATGFSNPVRVVFQSVFRPTLVEDTRDTVAEHFRTAIRRQFVAVHVVDRMALVPARRLAIALADRAARMHHGRLNAYLAYVLGALVLVLLIASWL